jgi:D-glycero-D-manno-heptose 1,7-bisphosphate phosphatase
MADATRVTRLILLDRDGVINEDSPDFIRTVDEFIPLPDALESMVRLHRAGFKLGVCTNQSAIARGFISEEAVQETHRRLEADLSALGGALDAVVYCPHHPDDDCECRKPRPGMLLEVMTSLGIAPVDTVFVGDSKRDLEAAQAAGCRGVLVRTGNGRVTESELGAGAKEVYDDLAAFTDAEIQRQAAQQ